MSRVRHCIQNEGGTTLFHVEERDDGRDDLFMRAWRSPAEYEQHVCEIQRLALIRKRLASASPFAPFYADVAWLLEIVEGK